jgi:hypothetical protein
VTIGNSVVSIGTGAFQNCTGLTSVTIGNSVVSIGSNAFYNCTGLTSVIIPNSVTEIEMQAFDGCTGLTSVTIGNSVASIGNYAFDGCTGLTSITIPSSVTEIGNNAFDRCTGLTSVISLSAVPPTMGSNVFRGVDRKEASLYVPEGSTDAYKSADVWKDFEHITDDEPPVSVSYLSSSSAHRTTAPRVVLRGNTLSVSSSSGSAARVRLLDVRGRVVRNFSSTDNANFSLSSVSAGRYFVEVRDEGGKRFTSGVVIVR